MDGNQRTNGTLSGIPQILVTFSHHTNTIIINGKQTYTALIKQ